MVGGHPPDARAEPANRGLRRRSHQVTRYSDAGRHYNGHDRTPLTESAVLTAELSTSFALVSSGTGIPETPKASRCVRSEPARLACPPARRAATAFSPLR